MSTLFWYKIYLQSNVLLFMGERLHKFTLALVMPSQMGMPLTYNSFL